MITTLSVMRRAVRAEAHRNPEDGQHRRAVVAGALDELGLLGEQVADDTRQLLEIRACTVVLIGFHRYWPKFSVD